MIGELEVMTVNSKARRLARRGRCGARGKATLDNL